MADQSFVTVGNRIPRDFFVTGGIGESDITIHAGSYHLALRAAGIEWANQIAYSSILPGIARLIDKPDTHVHGEVMETITATASCEYGSQATAGLIWGWLHDRETGERYGGLVAEYSGSLPEQAARGHLREMINELYQNGYSHFTLKDVEVRLRSVTPEKMYGTALVSLCFTSYDWPIR